MIKQAFRRFIFIALVTLVVCANLISALAAEIYTWEEKASMSEGRNLHTIVASDDKIYVIGGMTANGQTTKLEVYDPSTDTWEEKASMLNIRTSFAAAYHNNMIYVFGGYSDENSKQSNVEVYNISTDTWETRLDMATRRVGSKAVTVGNKIYLIGGYSTEFLKRCDVYSPSSDTWESKSEMPEGRGAFGLAAIDNNIYVIGGNTEGNVKLDSVLMYDTVNDTWANKASMSSERVSLEAGVIDGKIYTVFGHSDTTSYIDEVNVYDPVLNSWSIATNYPYTVTEQFSATSLNNKIFIAGGHSMSGHSDKLTVLSLSNVTIPVTPTNLTATPDNNQVTLNWDNIEGTETYTVKKSTTQGGPYIAIAENITDTSYLDTSVVNGITYYYVVTAVNQAGESDPSNEASATPVAPIVNRAILSITMHNSLIKEYDMSMTEVDNFISWYNSSGSDMYTINKSYNIGPFLSRKDYLIKDMIVCFEVMEYME